jgi:hypothetical protein
MKKLAMVGACSAAVLVGVPFMLAWVGFVACARFAYDEWAEMMDAVSLTPGLREREREP